MTIKYKNYVTNNGKLVVSIGEDVVVKSKGHTKTYLACFETSIHKFAQGTCRNIVKI